MLGPHSGSGRWHRLFADTLAGFPELRLLFLNLNNRIWTPGFHHLFSCFSYSTAFGAAPSSHSGLAASGDGQVPSGSRLWQPVTAGSKAQWQEGD